VGINAISIGCHSSVLFVSQVIHENVVCEIEEVIRVFWTTSQW
jgi:hypothetical protein